jgi:hypothetical protein
MIKPVVFTGTPLLISSLSNLNAATPTMPVMNAIKSWLIISRRFGAGMKEMKKQFFVVFVKQNYPSGSILIHQILVLNVTAHLILIAAAIIICILKCS